MDNSSYVLLQQVNKQINKHPINDRFDFKPEKGAFLASHDSFRSQISDLRPTTLFEIVVYIELALITQRPCFFPRE